LAAHLTRAIESMAGAAPQVAPLAHELSEDELETGPDKLVWWEQEFSLDPGARIWIGAAPLTWQEIGKQVLRGAGIEDQDQDAETVRGTYLEIVGQSLSGVASAISGRVRKEVSCSGGRESPPPSLAGVACCSLEITFGESAVGLLAAFSASWANLAEAAEESPADDHPPSARPASASGKPNSIDLLLDVELPVSISFGRAQLPLKDVMKLTTGSIVELNRAVSEPVEVIVNNCVIARGEVVVVEGNFGIRIQEVISRQERLRTLN